MKQPADMRHRVGSADCNLEGFCHHCHAYSGGVMTKPFSMSKAAISVLEKIFQRVEEESFSCQWNFSKMLGRACERRVTTPISRGRRRKPYTT